MDSVPDDNKPLNFLPVIVGGVAFACLMVIIVCVVWLCRRSGGKGKGKKDDIEMKQQLVETFPSEFRRTCHYLNTSRFFPTRAYTKCIGLFEVNGNLTLVGPHGSGKTMIAVSLLNKMISTMRNGKKCIVDVCSSVEEVESKVVDNMVSCVLLEDGFEKYSYQPGLLKNNEEIFGSLSKLIDEGKLCLICTVTDTIWKTNAKVFNNCPLFKKDLVIELSEKTFTLNEHEKIEILKKHLSYEKFHIVSKPKEENLSEVNKRMDDASLISISEKTLKKWAKKARVKGGIGIPLLFDLMSVNRHLFASADTLLGDSLESVLKMRITHLWKETKEQVHKDYVALLAFTACSGGRVSIKDFEKGKEDKKYVGICSRIGCSKKLQDEVDLMLKSKEMHGFLHPLGPDSYIFHHKILTPLVLSVFTKDNASLVAEHADLDVLFKVLQPLKAKYPMSVSLSEEALIALISRICTEKPDDIDKWKQHVVMQTGKLQKAFEKALKENGVKE
ncbi:uncharacterized protein LOC111134856 isoform X2 [Crassostrea virginica]